MKKVFFVRHQVSILDTPEEIGAFKTEKEAEDYMIKNNLFKKSIEFDNCYFIYDDEFDDDEDIMYTEEINW